MKKNIILLIMIIISVNLVGIVVGLSFPLEPVQSFVGAKVEPIMDYIAQIEDERAEVRAQRAEARAQRAEARRAEDSHTDKYYSEPVDNKLQQTLNRIAGTYELVENLGIYGYKTIYTVTINRDGTGRIVYNGGDVENFSSAHLSGSNKIVFNGNYGGTTFLLSGSGIDDESTRKYIENGIPKYIMRRR